MSKLIEEPTSLPAHHIYQGGSAPGVQCANCSAGATSGSWRRGWELEDKNNANLCNRCGQRWVKLGKALAKNGFAQAAAIVDPRPRHAGPPPRLQRPSSGGAGGAPTVLHAGTKRPFSLFNASNLSSHHASQRRSSTATMRSRLRSETTSENSEGGGGGLSTNDDSPPRLPFNSPELATLALGSTPNKYLSTTTTNNTVSPSHGQYPSQNYAPKYSLQKLSEGRTTYALFWVLGSRASGGSGSPILAVVGIDTRSSGHFSYTSLPGICPPSTTSLRCTSRTDVISWLVATMGVDPREKPVPESHARLPPLTIPELLSMLGEDDTQHTTTAGGGGYTPNIPGQLPLAESPFVSPVVARSSPTKLDRGAKIKPGLNGQPALVLNSNNTKTTAPTTAAAAAGTPSQAHLVHDLQNSSSLPRFRCGACGRDDHATDDCFLNCTSPPPLIHNPGATDIHTSLDALLLPAANGAGAPGAGNGGAHNNSNNGNILGIDDLLFGNGEDDSPMQATAFDSFLDFSFGPGGALMSPGEPSPGTVTQPVVARTALAAPPHIHSSSEIVSTSLHNGSHPAAGTHSAAAGVGVGPSSMPPPPPAAHFGPKQQQQQQGLKDGLEDTIRDWAITLTGNISESIPFAQGGGRWVPLGEALAILHHLSMLDLSLEILEKTQISRAVAMLRNHSNLSVASAAHALAARWHQYAVAALQSANNPHLSNNTRSLVK